MRSLRKSFGARGVVAMEAEEAQMEETRRREEEAAAAAASTDGDNTTTMRTPEPEETGAGDELLPEESPSENVETELMEVTDASDDVDDQVDQVEDAEDVVEAMEAFVDLMKTAAEQGGLDRHGARAVQLGLEGLYERVGLTQSKLMPSLESYGGVSSRIGATQIAMEEVKEQIKKVIDAIIAAFERIANWVKDLYAKFVKGAEATKGRAERLMEAAKAAKGEREEEIDNERTAAGIAVGTEVNPQKAAGEIMALVKNQAKVAQGLEKSAEIVKSVAEGKKDALGEYAAVLEAVGFKMTDGVAKSEVYPGNVVIAVEAKVDAENVQMSVAVHHEEAKVDGKFKSLSSEEAAKLAEEVVQIAEEVIKNKAEFEKISGSTKSLIEELKKAAGKEETETTVLRHAVAAHQKLVTQLLPAGDRIALNACKHLLDVVEQSVRGHKGEEKKPEAKPAEPENKDGKPEGKKDDKAAA